MSTSLILRLTILGLLLACGWCPVAQAGEATPTVNSPIVVTVDRPHVLVTKNRLSEVKKRTAQVKVLGDLVKKIHGVRPQDDGQMVLMLIDHSLARHVLDDPLSAQESERLLTLCCQFFDEKAGKLTKELLDEFELLHMLDGAAYAYDLCYHDLSKARRTAVAEHLLRWRHSPPQTLCWRCWKPPWRASTASSCSPAPSRCYWPAAC